MFVKFDNAVLADHEDNILDALEVSGERIIEVSRPVEAEFGLVFGRGNRLTTLSFTVQRAWEDYGAAETRALRMNRDLPDVAELVIKSSDEADTFRVAAAGLQSIKARAEGVMTIESYTFICGMDAAKT